MESKKHHSLVKIIYDYVIKNDDLEKSVSIIEEIIKYESKSEEKLGNNNI